MVPRNEIIAVEETETVGQLRETFIDHGFSRIPIYNETIDNIIGYAHSFDMFRNPRDISSIIKPILFIPETMPANVALSKFIRERQNIAVVVDEFGGTSGMVTMEDIIEEIFGEIEDEFDEEEMMETSSPPGNIFFPPGWRSITSTKNISWACRKVKITQPWPDSSSTIMKAYRPKVKRYGSSLSGSTFSGPPKPGLSRCG